MKTDKIIFLRIVPSLFKHFFSLVILIFVLSPLLSVVHGAEVILAWDANTEPDLAGYNIYYGAASGDYSHSIDVADTTEYTVTDLDDGGTYYFAATAYDQDGNESAYSEELVHTCGNGKPKPPPPEDSDGDGVPDDQDDFSFDPNEATDTDDDGLGNNADSDDDNDGIPDDWEIQHGLDPLIDDASEDPDGDGFSNLNEYLAGTDPKTFEDPSVPDAPLILAPSDNEIVSWTPELKTDVFYDPEPDDIHTESQWQIFRADDNFCLFDITSSNSLTSLIVPKLILKEDMDYIWKVRFFNNRGGASQWSAVASFTTDFVNHDLNGNGVPDHQEADPTIDLDQNGVMDIDQDDIKCIDTGAVQVGISIRDAENVDSFVSMEIEEPDDGILVTRANVKPAIIQFGLLAFKLLVKAPGDETVVTIYLSKAAAENGQWYKYDPVNAEWVDYAAYTLFSADRKKIYLSIKDGGFGDADGIENGIIVDPLAYGLDDEVDSNNRSSSNSDSDISCFISTAASRPADGQSSKLLWHEIRVPGLSIFLVLVWMVYFSGKTGN